MSHSIPVPILKEYNLTIEVNEDPMAESDFLGPTIELSTKDWYVVYELQIKHHSVPSLIFKSIEPNSKP